MSEIKQEIRFGGSNDDLVWKSPISDFNTGTVVTVHESQGAVFYLNGEASDDLGAGLHVLETCQVPFVRKLIQKIQGTKDPFQAELYFVNKVEIPQLRWGVGDITYHEEGFVFPIGARGMYNVSVVNARKLIEKINGTDCGFTRDELEARFLELVASAVDDVLINAIYDKAGSIIEAPRYRTEIMRVVEQRVADLFDEYGLKITQFIIERIHVDESNRNYQKLLSLFQLEGGGRRARLLEAEIAAQEREIKGQGEAAYRAAQGYTYQQERQFDVLSTAAQNESDVSGGMVGSFMQMGVGLGAAGAIGGIMKENISGTIGNLSSSAAPTSQPCKKCGTPLTPGAKFCLECGTRVAEEPVTVFCPHCGKQIQKGRFCPECGGALESLKKTCPNCSAAVEASKFCPECGTKVE